MEIITLASGSSGNAYLLKQNNEYILLECGIPFKALVNKFIERSVALKDIKGVIVSHSHKDHSKAVNDLLNVGFTIYGTADVLDYECPNYKVITKGSKFSPVAWLNVSAFEVIHDVECLGFILNDSVKDEFVLFMTDCGFSNYNFGNLEFNKVFIECNHLQNAAIRKFNETKDFKYKRQLVNHLSLAGCKRVLMGLNLEKCKEIHLIHSSKDIGYPELCKTDIEKKFNKNTFIY